MDQYPILVYLADALKTNKGAAVAAIVIVFVVNWFKTAPYIKDKLTTVGRKRAFALVMAVLPVLALVLWRTHDYADALSSAFVAFLTATGLNRVIPDSSSKDPVVVGEAVAKIIEEKKDVPAVVLEKKKPEEKPAETTETPKV